MPDNDTTYLHAAVKLYRTSQDRIMYSVLGVPTVQAVFYLRNSAVLKLNHDKPLLQKERERETERATCLPR